MLLLIIHFFHFLTLSQKKSTFEILKNHSQYSALVTERLILRPTDLNDADFILELLNTPDWHKFIGDRNVHTKDDASNYITLHITSQLERLGFTSNTVIRKEDGVKMGTCGLYDRPGLQGVDLGFAFLPQFYKMGFAYESAQKLLETAKTEYNLNNINAITVHENFASQQLLIKLGFQYVKDILLDGSDKLLQLYSIHLSES